MRIFLADDDEIIRMGMKKLIEKSNLNCTVVGEAADGELALKEMKKCGPVDLLITDIRMPVMNGLELIRNIRKENAFLKIIVLSGFDDFKYVRNAFMDGAVDYLLKPVNKADLYKLLEEVGAAIEDEAKEENTRKEGRGLLAANLLDKLFHEKSIEEAEAIKELDRIGIRLGWYFMVMITRVDHYYRQKLDQMEYKGKLNDVESRIRAYTLDDKSIGLEQYIYKHEIVSLVYSDEELDEAAVSGRLHGLLHDMEEEDITYTMGVSRVYGNLRMASFAYEEAVLAADTRFYLGRNHRILYTEIASKCIDIVYDPEPRVSELVHYLELCDYIHAKHAMEQIFLDLSYSKPQVFRKYVNDILEMLFLRVQDFKAAILSSEHDYMFNISYINTYNELRSYMNSILQTSIEYIRHERNKRSQKRIELAKRYIQEHYQQQITLNDVADHVELNASYFSNLFKTELGINFSEFLLETRINMAKQLLGDPKIKVYEIGSRVGYEDAVSFGRAFKKKVGLSPKEYRNTVY